MFTNTHAAPCAGGRRLFNSFSIAAISSSRSITLSAGIYSSLALIMKMWYCTWNPLAILGLWTCAVSWFRDGGKHSRQTPRPAGPGRWRDSRHFILVFSQEKSFPPFQVLDLNLKHTSHTHTVVLILFTDMIHMILPCSCMRTAIAIGQVSLIDSKSRVCVNNVYADDWKGGSIIILSFIIDHYFLDSLIIGMVHKMSENRKG